MSVPTGKLKLAYQSLARAEAREKELQQRLTAADERADVLEGLLQECLDCVRNGEDFDLPITTMGRIDAALKPVEGGGDA